VRERREQWKSTPNDVALARAFVHPVRVRVEMKLWDLLASDPTILKDPTLNDFLGRIANARNRGEVPFNEEPFRKLLELSPLKRGAPFRDIINKAHHGKADQITPCEAEIVDTQYNEVFAAIDACWLSYARFMGRLPPEDAVPTAAISAPTIVSLPDLPIPFIGRLAARESGAALATVEQAVEYFSLSSLGPIALFTLRAPTLGLVAFPGQTLIVSPSAVVKNGDIAVVRTEHRTYARRIGIDKQDPSRVVLEAMPSTNPHIPPTHFVRRTGANLLKVVGVLFDEVGAPKSQDEAVTLARSPILDQVVAGAYVAGDSAFPVAVNGGRVLLGRPPGEVSLLVGRIIALMTRNGQQSEEYFAYLKRLGKSLPAAPDVYYLENVGESGEGEYVQFARGGRSTVTQVPIVEQMWKVHGTLF
jgi:hypothetical protein